MTDRQQEEPKIGVVYMHSLLIRGPYVLVNIFGVNNTSILCYIVA